MTEQRLTRLIDAYGANEARWPEEDRAAALAFIESTSGARTSIEDARSFDLLLSAGDDNSPVSDSLRQSILLAGPKIRNPGPAPSIGLRARLRDMFSELPMKGWQGAMAMAALILIGGAITLTTMTDGKPAATDIVTTNAPTPVIVTARLEDSEEAEFEAAPGGVDALSLTGEIAANAGEYEIRQESDDGADGEIPMI